MNKEKEANFRNAWHLQGAPISALETALETHGTPLKNLMKR